MNSIAGLVAVVVAALSTFSCVYAGGRFLEWTYDHLNNPLRFAVEFVSIMFVFLPWFLGGIFGAYCLGLYLSTVL